MKYKGKFQREFKEFISKEYHCVICETKIEHNTGRFRRYVQTNKLPVLCGSKKCSSLMAYKHINDYKESK